MGFETWTDIMDRLGDGGGFEQGESVLEERFWDLMNRTAERHRGAKPQFQIDRFRVDSIVDCDGHAVVVELDGERYHLDKRYDQARDDYLCQFVSGVIRIPFHAIWNCPDATFAILGLWFPRFAIKHEAIRYETHYATLSDYGYRQVFSPSISYGLVHWAKDWSEGDNPHRIRITRGRTDPKIIARIHG